MDTRFLESFVAVVEHGSMADAARRLNLTPAAVAQRVKALERELGAALLGRVGRTVKPTEVGLAVVSRARPVLAELRSLSWLSDDAGPSGELRLGAVSTALTGLLPDILARLAVSSPRIEVYVAPGTSRDLYGRVSDGDLDAAVLVRPPFALPKTVEWRLLREEDLLVISPGQGRDADIRTLLRSEPFIRYDRSHWGGRLADTYLRRIGVEPRDRCELDALESIAVMVDRGLGVSIVPDWAPPWPEGLRLNKWIVPAADLKRQIGVLFLKASPRTRLVTALLSEAEDRPVRDA